jgi:hypothetical protein
MQTHEILQIMKKNQKTAAKIKKAAAPCEKAAVFLK